MKFEAHTYYIGTPILLSTGEKELYEKENPMRSNLQTLVKHPSDVKYGFYAEVGLDENGAGTEEWGYFGPFDTKDAAGKTADSLKARGFQVQDVKEQFTCALARKIVGATKTNAPADQPETAVAIREPGETVIPAETDAEGTGGRGNRRRPKADKNEAAKDETPTA